MILELIAVCVFEYMVVKTFCCLQGEIIQKMLHIYLENSELTSDLLDELACSILPQVLEFVPYFLNWVGHFVLMLCVNYEGAILKLEIDHPNTVIPPMSRFLRLCPFLRR